jgi:hypothetical protein
MNDKITINERGCWVWHKPYVPSGYVEHVIDYGNARHARK